MAEIHQLRILVAVAETGGFAAAGRLLSVSAPVVTRSIAALERQLAVRLIERTTRQVKLTDAGSRFASDARHVLGTLDQAELAARTAQSFPEGELSITAPATFGRLHVAPLLLEFLAQHPGVRARAMFVDHVVNLVAEQIDLAVRIGQLRDSSLTAVRVGAVRNVVVAAPTYLDTQGTPHKPDDLAAHRAVQLSYDIRMAQWTFPAGGNGKLYAPAQPEIRLIVNSQDTAIEAALAGHGLIRALSYQVRDLLHAGRLRRVLTDYETTYPVHLVYPGGGKAPARVRAFMEFAAPRLRGHPALSESNRTLLKA